MRANAGIFIIICLLFLVGTVAATDASVISTSKNWVIANGSDQSTITVNVQNNTGPINGAKVDFTIDNSVYGTMSPATVITGPSGSATSTFTVNTKSGTAIITATISYNDGGIPVTATKTVSQNIDHDILSPKFTPATGIVGQEIPFNLSITDQWGNPIDNRRSDDTVSLSVSCPLPNDCEFIGYGHSFSSRPDSNGNLMVPLQLGTKSGLTTIVMSPVQDLSQQVFMIDTLAGDPILTVDVSPAAVPPGLPTVPVNTGVFNFSYTLSDKFGNPVVNQPILIHTSLDENLLTKTNAFGQTPVLSYGPKGVVSTVDITATVVNSTPLITNQFTVAFTTAEPKDMTLIVTPHAMGSLDYDPGSKADVVVRVLDNFGNPVSGQDITLTLGSPSYTAGSASEDIHPYLNSPSLTSYSGTTDAEGKVTAVFVPGNFTSTESSEGSCLLTATWASNPSYTPKTVTLTWTNRPYVNVDTSVNPQTIAVNGTIDITIKVSVNGKTGKYRPITLVIDQDTSASMKNPSEGNTPRVVWAANAAEGFLNSLDASNTRVGLEIFGYNQSIGHMPIPSAFSSLINNYKNLDCYESSKGMEKSIETSYDKIIDATGGTHENDVKALIILSDGGSNLDTQGTLDGLISKAKNNRIHVFVIAYLKNPGSATAEANFGRLTKETGGKYYASDNSAEIAGFYKDIEKLIKQLADEDTTMTVSFQNIVIDNTAYDGSDVYDYVPVGPFTPLQTTVNPDGRTSIIWPNSSQTVKDQSLEWPNLKFNVGAIDIGQNWSTTFRLKVKQNGTFNVFGAGSISLNGKTVPLPDSPATVLPDIPPGTFKAGTLSVDNLHEVNVPSVGYYTAFIPLQWNTNYDSPTLTNFATETVYYRIAGSTAWHPFDGKSAPVGEFGQTTTLDVRNLPSGSYDFQVHADAVDADDAYSGIITVEVAHGSTSTYIKLK